MTAVGIMASGVHIAAPAGNDILLEPFNNYTFAPWAASGASITASGRTGNAAQINAFAMADYTITVPNRGDVITIGGAFKVDATAVVRDLIGLWSPSQFAHAGRVHTDVSTGKFFVSNAAGVQLGAVTGVIAANTWYYVEAQFKLATAGYIIARLDGVEVINIASTNTKPGAGTVFEVVRMISGGGVYWADDMYITMGAGAPFKGSITIP